MIVERKFYTATEAARLLDLNEKTVRRRIARGEIPAEKGALETGAEAWQIPADWLHSQLPNPTGQETGQQPDIAGQLPDTPEYADGQPTGQNRTGPTGAPVGNQFNPPDTPADTTGQETGQIPDIPADMTGIVLYDDSRERVEELARRVANLEGMAAQKSLFAGRRS